MANMAKMKLQYLPTGGLLSPCMLVTTKVNHVMSSYMFSVLPEACEQIPFFLPVSPLKLFTQCNAFYGLLVRVLRMSVVKSTLPEKGSTVDVAPRISRASVASLRLQLAGEPSDLFSQRKAANSLIFEGDVSTYGVEFRIHTCGVLVLFIIWSARLCSLVSSIFIYEFTDRSADCAIGQAEFEEPLMDQEANYFRRSVVLTVRIFSLFPCSDKV